MNKKILLSFCMLCVFAFLSCDKDDDETRITASSIEFSQVKLEMEENTTQTITVKVLPKDAIDKTVVFSSSDEEVITVDANGLLSAKKVGESVITANCLTVSKSCKIVVTPKPEIVPEGKSRFKGKFIDSSTSKKSASKRTLLVVYTEKFTEANFADGLENNSIEVNSDGTFSLDVDKAKDFILFLMENNKVKGLIGINTANGEYWENLNSEHLDEITQLGDIPSASDNGLLIAQNTLTDLNIAADKSELIKKISKVDDHIRTYVNFTNSGFKNFASPGFVFSADLKFAEQINADAMSYAGYQIYAWGKELDNQMKLVPPSPVSRGNGQTFNADNPITGEAFNPDSETKFMGFIGGETADDLLQGEIPNGEWLLQNISGEEKESYILNSIAPIQDQKISVPVPAVKINSDNDGVITTIDLEWQYYRKGELVTIEDRSLLKNKLSNLNIEYIQGEDTSEDHTFKYDDTAITPTNQKKWSINGNNNNPKLNLLVIGYTIDCVFYQVKMVLPELNNMYKKIGAITFNLFISFPVK